MVTGDVSSSDSSPQPTLIGGAEGWRCAAATPGTPLQLNGGEGGIATIASESDDCHVSATILTSTWHRDFLLVLIGAFLAVGVHMMFQAMVEAGLIDRRPSRDSEPDEEP